MFSFLSAIRLSWVTPPSQPLSGWYPLGWDLRIVRRRPATTSPCRGRQAGRLFFLWRRAVFGVPGILDWSFATTRSPTTAPCKPRDAVCVRATAVVKDKGLRPGLPSSVRFPCIISVRRETKVSVKKMGSIQNLRCSFCQLHDEGVSTHNLRSLLTQTETRRLKTLYGS